MRPAVITAAALALVLIAGAVTHGLAALQTVDFAEDIDRLNRGERLESGRLAAATEAYRAALDRRDNGINRALLGRLYCAKAAAVAEDAGLSVAALPLARSYTGRCLDLLEGALQRDPALPYAAFVYARVGSEHGAATRSLDAALRRSIATGPALPALIAPRLDLALSLWPMLTPQARGAVAAQLRLARRQSPELIEDLSETALRRALIASLLREGAPPAHGSRTAPDRSRE